jgi:hypothetical protein
LNPKNGKIYAYYQDAMLAFDPATCRWADLKVAPFNRRFAWSRWTLTLGSLAWDPVNDEVLSIGGTSDEPGGSPGTWVFKPGGKKWRRIELGSEPLKALRSRASTLARDTAALVNAWRNRFHVAETEKEAKADLGPRATSLMEACEKLQADIRAAKLSGAEAGIPTVASAEFVNVLADFREFADQATARERLLAGQVLVDHINIAARTLDAEPGGRGVSQMAVDPVRGKIVLFGGVRLDSYLADTWVYDCKTRTWEQKFPAVSPAPRCGHVLAWLPKSGKVVLFGANIYEGGYGTPHGNPHPPQDLWTYDIERNTWKRIEQKGKPPTDGTGAIGPNDKLLFLPRNGKGERTTWAIKIDADAPDAGSKKKGVAPGTVAWIFNGPDHFDKASKIEPDKIDSLIKGLKPNVWTLMPAQGPRCNGHEWGTSAYDARRHQILFFGGGHSAWHYNDVSHYSMRTATWSVGYREEYPFPGAGFKALYDQTFNDRPFFGSHIWNGEAYDAVADRFVTCPRGGAWTYDPATRRWTYPPTPADSVMTMALHGTPHGVVQWARTRLFVFDPKASTFKPLPMTGDKLTVEAYCDEAGLCYNSKRDCLWLTRNGSPIFRYEFDTGKLTRIDVPKPEHVFAREMVYVPALDMLLSAMRAKASDGTVVNLAFDIAASKWVGIELPCVDGKPRTISQGMTRFDDALHYDPELQIAIWHDNNREVLVARLDKAKLKRHEVRSAKTGGR